MRKMMHYQWLALSVHMVESQFPTLIRIARLC
jgi:hypothetical protein